MELLAKCPAADFIEIEFPMRNAFIKQHKPIKQIGKQIFKLNKFNFLPISPSFPLGKNNTSFRKMTEGDWENCEELKNLKKSEIIFH